MSTNLSLDHRVPLPKFLASKKAIINPKNSDQECFKWTVTEAVYPQKSNRDRITKTARTTLSCSTGMALNFQLSYRR